MLNLTSANPRRRTSSGRSASKCTSRGQSACAGLVGARTSQERNGLAGSCRGVRNAVETSARATARKQSSRQGKSLDSSLSLASETESDSRDAILQRIASQLARQSEAHGEQDLVGPQQPPDHEASPLQSPTQRASECHPDIDSGSPRLEDPVHKSQLILDVGSEKACTAAGAAALQKQRDAQFLHGLRRDLEALKEPVINQRATPYPWGRCHMFRDDDDFDLSSGLDEAHHCSILSLEQLEVLRRETNELLRPTLPPGRAKRMYDAARLLSCLRNLLPAEATALLEDAELVELGEGQRVIWKGKPVEWVFIIASGSLRIENTDAKRYAGHRVTVDTLYDGQLFAEGKPVSNACIVAQEPIILLKVHRHIYNDIVASQHAGDGGAPSDRSGCGEIDSQLSILRKSILLDHLSDSSLNSLIENGRKLSLRYRDEVVQVGKVPLACFFLLSGFCKIVAPSAVDCAQDGPPQEVREVIFTCLESSEGLAAGSVRCASATHTSRPSTARSLRSSYSASAKSRFGSQSRWGEPRTQRGTQPGSSYQQAAAPHNQRRGAEMQQELEIGRMHPGAVFGFCTLTDSKDGWSIPSETTVRVNSSSAELLAITARTLLYLPDAAAAAVLSMCEHMEDPVRLHNQRVQKAQEKNKQWMAKKHRLLYHHTTKKGPSEQYLLPPTQSWIAAS